MKKVIYPDIIAETTKCCFDFQCLKENGKPHCVIEDSYHGNVFFVKCTSSLNCGYALSICDSKMCTCPIREKLYLKYKI